MKALFATTALLLSMSLPSAAFTDDVTGLGVALPDSYDVTAIPDYDLPPDSVGFVISSRNPALALNMGGELCRVAFAARPERSLLTQQQLNDRMNSEVVDAWKADTFEGIRVLEVSAFDHSGLSGLQAVLRYTGNVGYLALHSIFETPAGLTDVSCTAREDDFEAARETFVQIRDAIIPPA